jgi:hypothetical protein
MRWAPWSKRSKMASARVGSPKASCQRAGHPLGRQLAGDDGRTTLDAIFDHLQEVTRLLSGEWLEPEVVDGKHADPSPGGHQSRQPAITASCEQFGEHARGPLIESG